MSPIHQVDLVIVVIVFVGSLIVGSIHLSLSLGKEEGRGVLFHKGFKLYNPNVLLLVADMKSNPDKYQYTEYVLQSQLVYIWTASGWAFYKDHYSVFTKLPILVGPFSVADRFLFSRALKRLKAAQKIDPAQTPQLDFEIALRQQNGMIKR